MKNYLTLIILLFTVYSCKKNSPDNNGLAEKKHKIVFTIQNFSSSTGDFEPQARIKTNDTDTPIGNIIKVLYCAVYDANGNPLNVSKQLATQPNFGNVNLNLENGNYTIIFAGGQNDLAYTSTANLNNAVIRYPEFFNQDTFYKKLTLSVENSDATSQVSLDRIVGKVQITIQDALPIGLKTITIQQRNKAREYYKVSSGQPGYASQATTGLSTTYNISSDDIGESNYTMSYLSLTPATPVGITVSANRANQTHITYIYIKGITVQPNKTTLVTGKLFQSESPSPEGGFTIDLNTLWNPNDINVGF